MAELQNTETKDNDFLPLSEFFIKNMDVLLSHYSEVDNFKFPEILYRKATDKISSLVTITALVLNCGAYFRRYLYGSFTLSNNFSANAI